MFWTHQNVCLAYYLQTSQPELKNVYLVDVSLLFLYPYVGKTDKDHRHTTKIHYLHPAACR